MSVEWETCPSFWTTDEQCAKAPDGGDGKHHCAVEPSHGPFCVCLCGERNKRPVDHAERYEQRIGRASLQVDERGIGKLMAGLTDISNQVSGVVVDYRAGRPPVLRVEMPAAAFVARGEIELDDATAGALLAIGWRSPDDVAQLARLAGLDEGTSWDDLADWIRRVSSNLDELPVSMGGRNEG